MEPVLYPTSRMMKALRSYLGEYSLATGYVHVIFFLIFFLSPYFRLRWRVCYSFWQHVCILARSGNAATVRSAFSASSGLSGLCLSVTRFSESLNMVSETMYKQLMVQSRRAELAQEPRLGSCSHHLITPTWDRER